MKTLERQPVTQEHGTGCAVACVAYVLKITYVQALKLFSVPAQAWGRGFYCREIIEALNKGGKRYAYSKINTTQRAKFKDAETIVYIGRSEKYPLGHYLVRTELSEWMNPWINFPSIAPAKSAFEKRLPGKPTYEIHPAK
jgi:hypothetical protein